MCQCHLFERALQVLRLDTQSLKDFAAHLGQTNEVLVDYQGESDKENNLVNNAAIIIFQDYNLVSELNRIQK